MPAPGEVVSRQFSLRHPTTRLASNADSLPTAVLVRTGDNTSITCTVTNITTGVYKVTATIPATYIAGDELEFRISAIVATVPGSKIIIIGEVETRASVVPTATSTDWVTNLTNTRAAFSQTLLEISASPKVSYSVDGQSVSWTDYQAFLVKAIKDIDDLLLTQDPPYEEVSCGYF